MASFYLNCATEDNQTDAVKELLPYTIAIAGDNTGRTALHWSVSKGNEETVALLLSKDFVFIIPSFQMTPSSLVELMSDVKSLGFPYSWVFHR